MSNPQQQPEGWPTDPTCLGIDGKHCQGCKPGMQINMQERPPLYLDDDGDSQ